VTRSYIGLGANLGNPLAALREARRALSVAPGISLEGSSPIFRSAAVGPRQPDYLNAVLALDTSLSAPALLEILQGLESDAGRVRGERWGPRSLDLDLLLFGDEVIALENLTVPDPRIFERNFVLLPLAELCPGDWRFPDGSSLIQRCAACPHNPIERTEFGWHTAASDEAANSGTRPWPR